MFFNSSSTGTNNACRIVGNTNTCAEVDMGIFAITFGVAAAIVFVGAIICYCKKKRSDNDIRMNSLTEDVSRLAYNKV